VLWEKSLATAGPRPVKRKEDKTDMTDKIIAIIRKNIKTEAGILADTDMRKDLDIDSFDGLMIMNELDDEFGVSLDEDDFKQVNTPREIASLLKSKYGVNEI
jgi:acyl carrier protein